LDAQHRINRTLVATLMVAGLAVGALGIIELARSANVRDFLQPIGGFGLAGWSAVMLREDDPRPVSVLAMAMLLNVLFLVEAVLTSAPMLDFAEPPTITLVVTTGIVAMSSVSQWRQAWLIWSIGVIVSSVLILIGLRAPISAIVTGSLVTGIAAGAAMYMVAVNRDLIKSSEYEYTVLANSTALAVAEIDCATALQILSENGVTADNKHLRLADLALRNEVVEGITIARSSFGRVGVHWRSVYRGCAGFVTPDAACSTAQRVVVTRH
jgi:hypothetical protein